MCYVIVTCRSLIWMLLTLAATLGMISAIVTPRWLIGFSRSSHNSPVDIPNGATSSKTTSRSSLDTRDVRDSSLSSSSSSSPEAASYRPTLGLYNRCTVIHHADFHGALVDVGVAATGGGSGAGITSRRRLRENCARFVDSFSMPDREFPNFWKAGIIFFGIGLSLVSFTALTSLLGCCCRSICRKSIFTVSGLIQAIGGLFLIFGLVMFPAGWGNEKVRDYCGQNAAPFDLDQCDLGWAFYTAVGSTLLIFICSMLSVQAEISTSSDEVQDEILKGKTLICLP